MKVRLENETKKLITLADAPVVFQIIEDMKEDINTAEEYAEMAIMAIYNGSAYGMDIIKASASIALNNRAWNVFNENSGNIDIWIKATAYVNNDNNYEFIMTGVYFSDIYQIKNYSSEELASKMHIRRFKEVK